MILHLADTALDITVTDNSYRYQTIMGEHSLTLYFSLAEPIDIPLGAWCEFQGQTYTLYSPATFVKQSSRNFEYTAIMESDQSKLKLYKFRNPIDKRLKFSLTAKPKDHLRMVVDNLKLRDKEWSVGECIDAAEKSIQYSATGCDGALGQIAETFDTEWEVVGKTIHLRKVEYNKQNPLPLSYGRGNGFKPGVGRTNFDSLKPVEVLYAEGGDRNIDFSTYKSKTLLLPTGQSLVYEGRTYISDAEGYSISRAEEEKLLHTGQEQSLDLTHIYPGWEHTVTDARDVSDDEKVVKWDIFACNTADYPNNSPESLDYTKCRIKGDTARVIFQSGILAGKEFDLVQTANELTGYVHAERRYMLVSQEIDGQTMPSATFAPKLGDKFKVFGISMPGTYLRDDTTQTGVSWDMFREAAKWLYEHEEPRFSFTGELDGIWASGDWINIGGRIRLGGYVAFSDEQFQKEPVLIRISGVKDMINNPHSPIIELSNEVSGGSFMSEIGKIEQNEIVTEELHSDALQFTRRRWQDARQATQMLEKAMLDNFTGAVNPVAVHTMQLLVGDENLQFVFVNSRDNQTQDNTKGWVTITESPSQVSVSAGVLKHMTLGITTLAVTHADSEYKLWDIEPLISSILDDPTKSYYLYAKVLVTGTTGKFFISAEPIQMRSDTDHYHLLYGLISSQLDGERSFVALNGFAELTPGMLTIPMIKGQGADSAYFDLDKGEIGGKIVYKSQDNTTQTLINGGKISSDLIDTDTLIATRVKSKNNLFELDASGAMRATQGVLGNMYVDTAGDVTIKDQQGNVCSRFIKSQIAPLNTFLEGNASGNASTGSFVGSASLAAVTKDLDGILKVSVNNAKVHIEGVKAAVSITVVDKRDPLTLTAQVYIVSAAGGSTLLGSVSTTLTPGPFGGNSRNNITIDEEIALSADSYHIRVVYQGYADNWTDVTSSVSISAGTMSYNYVKQVNETQLGRGLGIIFDTNNYLHYGHIAANSPLVFSYRGLSDLPGVLAKAHIDSIGRISRKWGKNIISVENVTGQSYNKKIVFDEIKGEYSAICTAYGGGIAPVVYNENPTSVELYATGGFNIMLVGDNR